jgi:hypothetical protein
MVEDLAEDTSGMFLLEKDKNHIEFLCFKQEIGRDGMENSGFMIKLYVDAAPNMEPHCRCYPGTVLRRIR